MRKRMLHQWQMRVALGAVLLLTASCLGPNPEWKARVAAQPPAIQEAIRKKEVRLGMTPEQVALALGESDCILQTLWRGTVAEVWAYTYDSFTRRPAPTLNCKEIAMKVYFVNGQVVAVEK